MRRRPEPTVVGGLGLLEPVAAKVPEITVAFWVVKVLTTGMGEASSDFLAQTSYSLAGSVGVLGLALAMWLQFRTRRYRAPVYWFAAGMVAVFGTMAADGLHVGLGVPYLASTLFYAVVLAVVLVCWHRDQGTLSIHSIVSRRRETYYWATVFATFALGTALGDLTATSFQLGFVTSGLMFLGIIAIPLVAWRWFRLNPVVAFWFAYIVTRPLGASFADYLSKPHAISGLDLGDGPVAAVSLAVIVVLVAYLAVTRSDIQPSVDPGSRDRPGRGQVADSAPEPLSGVPAR